MFFEQPPADYAFDLDEFFSRVERGVRRYTQVLGDLGFVHGIDEIAIQVPNRLALLNLIQQAVARDGVVLSNTATDHVNTLPLQGCYSVDYAFLTGFSIDGVHPYRIEIMHKTHGFSPLHDAILTAIADKASAWCVHASFKVHDENEYGAATHALRKGGYESVQRCDSTYGRFSYWQPYDLDTEASTLGEDFLYLKPRVNLRDAQ